jgi:hypothetical protein
VADVDRLVGQAVAAIQRKVKAQQDQAEAAAEWRRTVGQLYRDCGLSMPEISRRLVRDLAAAGYHDPTGLGVSYDNVRKAVAYEWARR